MSSNFLVFDLETTPLPWGQFDEAQREYLLRGTQTPEEENRKKSEMALSPLTGRIVCIGMAMCAEGNDGTFIEEKSACYVTDDSMEEGTLRTEPLDDNSNMHFGTEKTIISLFWQLLEQRPNLSLISFNGRGFDAPFLMLRSAALSLRPARNLMDGSRFNYHKHIDLLDKLTFYERSAYGPMRRFNFDFYTKAFGIPSPKSEGVDGSMVADLYLDGRFGVIAEYCLRDVRATWLLYQHWSTYMKF